MIPALTELRLGQNQDGHLRTHTTAPVGKKQHVPLKIGGALFFRSMTVASLWCQQCLSSLWACAARHGTECDQLTG